MENFEKKKMLEIFKMDIEEAVDYFTKLRQYNYENNNPIELVQFRRKIHSLLINAIKIDRMLNKESITILNDRRKNNNKPIIYTATHIGGQDIERIAEAIKDHSYIFIGDPKELYKDLAGLILYLNGVIYIQTDNKIDRKIGKERSIEVLKNNDNLLIFPEAAWNFSDNKPVLGLFNGAVDMALKANADIVPVAIEQYNNHYIVNIGENIDVNNYNDLSQTEQTKILRDQMATLRWEIWENAGIMKREDINDKFMKQYHDNIQANLVHGYTIEEANRTSFKDKNITEPKEAFAFMENITPSKENAFLYRKTK
ncbi:MAG: 1-acyl-sn-glycerol-3-phosphate acyltransferase [Bacilli bacterium]|nr:1-acyl-sn-glycerol-3-phosphate acyltransferase [Bacilli bacterium]